MSGTTAPRQALPGSLFAYLPTVLDGWQHPTTVRQFASGQSNPTYLLTSAAASPSLASSASSSSPGPTQVVLRAKPRGKILDRTAHRIDREYGLLKAIGEHQRRTGREEVSVPAVFALCEDDRVAGSAFYLMEYIPGRIFTSVLLPSVEPSARRAYCHAAVTSLARLSTLSPSILPPALFPPPKTPFFTRQVSTLLRVSGAQAAVPGVGEIIRDSPERAEVLAFLQEGATVVDRWEDGRTAIVWGDAKMDNMVFHGERPTVVGLLDWELCAIGSPLSDLANMLLPWSLSNAEVPADLRRNLLIPLADASTQSAQALPARDELLDVWLAAIFPSADEGEMARKRKALWEAMRWVEVFIIYRLAIIAQGIQARVVLGQASSAAAKDVGSRAVVGLLGEVCLRKVREARTEDVQHKARL